MRSDKWFCRVLRRVDLYHIYCNVDGLYKSCLCSVGCVSSFFEAWAEAALFPLPSFPWWLYERLHWVVKVFFEPNGRARGSSAYFAPRLVFLGPCGIAFLRLHVVRAELNWHTVRWGWSSACPSLFPRNDKHGAEALIFSSVAECWGAELLSRQLFHVASRSAVGLLVSECVSAWKFRKSKELASYIVSLSASCHYILVVRCSGQDYFDIHTRIS